MLSALLSSLFLAPLVAAQGMAPPDWENPAVFQRGKQPAHATLMAFPSGADPSEAHLSSDFALSLNGSWKFHWAANPEQRPRDFFASDFDDTGWTTIEVPSNVELKGYGTPRLARDSFPFVAEPRASATTPVERHPVASYRRHFQLPEGWAGRRTLVAFEGVAGAYSVWCNGTRVGYSEDEHTTAEFDLTALLVPGDNQLAVEVHRDSDASYFAGEGTWNLSGIDRDVYLRSVGQVDLVDVEVRTSFEPEDSERAHPGQLDVLVQLRNHSKTDGSVEVRMRLVDESGTQLDSARIGVTVSGSGAQTTSRARWTAELADVEPWSAESPTLYTLDVDVIHLGEAGSEPVSSYALKVGFRSAKIEDGELLWNGAPLWIRGVDYAEHDPATGRALSEARLLEDLTAMKRHHINTLRTSSGPCSPRLLELCDVLGLYVWNAAPQLAPSLAASEAVRAQLPSWQATELDRFQSLVERDKNHVSVLAWSGGPAAATWFRTRDLPGLMDRDAPGALRATSAAPSDWAETQAALPADQRSVQIASSPLAIVGNGLAGLRERWEEVRALPHVQGLFLGDWVAPGLWTSAPPPTRLLGDRTDKHAVHLDGQVAPRLGLVSGTVRVATRPDLLGREGLTLATVLQANAEAGSGAGQPLITKGNGAWGLRIAPDGEHLEFYVVHLARQSLLIPFPDDWFTRAQHVIVTFDGGQLLVFTNGREIGRAEWSGPPDETAADLTIGRPAGTGDEPYFGSIRVLAFWERALELDEVLGSGLPEKGLALTLDMTEFESSDVPLVFFGLGDDFGDVAIGEAHLAGGLVTPDRRPTPALAEVQKVFQDLTFELVESSPGSPTEGLGYVVRILGAAPFGDLNAYDLVWSIADDGLQLAAGRMPMSDGTLHGATKRQAALLIPFVPRAAVTQERVLTLSAQLAEATAWAPAGFEVAWQQLALGGAFTYTPATTDEAVTSTSAGGRTVLASGPVRAAFDDATGSLVSLTRDGVEYLAGPLRPNFWRPPLGRELGASTSPFARWRHAGEDAVVEERNLLSIETTKQLGYDLNLGRFGSEDRGSVQLVWSMSPGGALELNFNLHPATLPDGSPGELLRVGMQARLPERFANATWYGRGPHESYPDRKEGARSGIFTSSVRDLSFPYLRAQESGNHSDVRWATFTDPEGHGLRFAAPEVTPYFGALEVGTYPGWMSDVERARHPAELPERDGFSVSIDAAQAGLGSADPGGALDAYRLGGNREYSYRFVIETL